MKQHDENTYPEYAASSHSGMAQGFNTPSPTTETPPRKLPQAGEGLHGERMSSLPSLKEDFDTSPGGEDERPASYNEQAMASARRSGQVVSYDGHLLEALPESESAMDIFNKKFGGAR